MAYTDPHKQRQAQAEYEHRTRLKTFCVRMTDEDKNLIDSMAERLHLGRRELIIRAVKLLKRARRKELLTNVK